MSKLLLVCFRDSSTHLTPGRVADGLAGLVRRITPDNITPNAARILTGPGLFAAVVNPTNAPSTRNTSAYVGNLVDSPNDWWRPGATVPDGSFALFRSDERWVELISDACASRTIWYASTERLFVASTSQRAIVYFLESYEPNREAHSWMLSSGGLGYGLSWDRRIKSLPGNSRVILDRMTWDLNQNSGTIEFIPDDLSDEEHEKNLREALEENFAHLQNDYSNWELLLSGGFDSRCILLMLKDHKDLRCVTWGLRSALQDKRSDAAISRRLASHFGLEFQYLNTDPGSDRTEIKQLFDRLLVAGEGRTDKISGYSDGLKIWKQLFESGPGGVIRGDIGFSPYSVNTPDEVTRSVGINSLSEYGNLSWASGMELARHSVPDVLQRRETETLSSWRDRLSYEFRCPVFWAGLNEIKASYVEIMNPFLTRRFVESTCRLPDHLRDNKVLFKKIVKSMSPDIPFADRSATAKKTKILQVPQVVETLLTELDQPRARSLLSDHLIDYIARNVKIAGPASTMRRSRLPPFLKGLLPHRVRKIVVNSNATQDLDINLLAFRAYIICRMQKILSEDASAIETEHLRLTG